MKKLKTIPLILFWTICSSCLHSQKLDFTKKIFNGFSYFTTEDCYCEYEPKGGYHYDNSFVTSIGLQWPIYQRFVLESNFGFFKRNYESNGINDQYKLSDGKVYYNETIHSMVNRYVNLRLGFIVGNSKLHFTPFLGLGIYSREEVSNEFTKYTFHQEAHSYNNFPDVEPIAVTKEKYDGVLYWRSWSRDIGLSIDVKLFSRGYLKLVISRGSTQGWIEKYSTTNKLWQIGGGIGYSFAKRNHEQPKL